GVRLTHGKAPRARRDGAAETGYQRLVQLTAAEWLRVVDAIRDEPSEKIPAIAEATIDAHRHLIHLLRLRIDGAQVLDFSRARWCRHLAQQPHRDRIQPAGW